MYRPGPSDIMLPKLTARSWSLLERALRKYNLEWDEPIGRIHPNLRRDGCVARKEDWVGRGVRKGIIAWKAARILGKATWDLEIPRTTRRAFELASTGSQDELTKAVELLDDLSGVGVRMATAILMFYDPERYSVMDVNAWRSLIYIGFADTFDFWYEDAEDYPAYNEARLRVSREFHRTLRETDRALWALGDSEGNPQAYETS